MCAKAKVYAKGYQQRCVQGGMGWGRKKKKRIQTGKARQVGKGQRGQRQTEKSKGKRNDRRCAAGSRWVGRRQGEGLGPRMRADPPPGRE